MHYRPLGRTGVSVSPLCLGAMMFGAFGNPDHDDSIRIVHRALDAGINFIDTADVYSGGESEEIVGKALAGGRRDNVVLATKVGLPFGEEPNHRGTSRRWITEAVEGSLRRLQTDWIDLYQIHRLSPATRRSPPRSSARARWSTSSPTSPPTTPSCQATCSIESTRSCHRDTLSTSPTTCGRRQRSTPRSAAVDGDRGHARHVRTENQPFPARCDGVPLRRVRLS